VELDDFWNLVEVARADCAEPGSWATAEEIGEALAERLTELPADDILAFDRWCRQTQALADLWIVCAACYLISGSVSADDFGDFKAGLIGLGQRDFEQVVEDPDALAHLPIVRAIAAGEADPFALHGRSIHFAAAAAFSELAASEDEEALWVARLDLDQDEIPARRDGWSGTFGPEDGPEIPAKLPKLYALFPRELAGPQP
jgi:hypothetical protein